MTPMPYRILEVEVTRPLPRVGIPLDRGGLALIARRKGRPIGFLMRAFAPGTVVAPEQMDALVGEAAGARLLEEQIREEVWPGGEATPLPPLTVAVCTHDHPDLLARCLASLIEARGHARSQVPAVELLVVDNAPSDERAREVAEGLAGVRYVREPKAGLNFARNRAVAEASGELLAFVDDDAVADGDYLLGLAEAWNENPDAAAFTGLVLPLELDTPAQILFEERGGFRRGFDKLRYQGQNLRGSPLYPCGAGTFGAGCNMAFRRDVLPRLGGFDEALDTGAPLPGGGDLDIFYRVIRAGHPLVYEPRFLVFHQHRREMAGLRRQYWTWGQGFMAFVDKTYRSDPDRRNRLRRLVWWWFRDQGTQLQKSLRGRHVLPPAMVAAELRGGLRGLFGEYRRSQRRVERIRRSAP